MDSKIDIDAISRRWNELIKDEDLNLSELQLSSLSSWVKDCFDSNREIYGDLLVKISNASPQDHDLIHDCVVEIYWQLNHIKSHIKDAEKGFAELQQSLASKAEGN